MNDHRLQMLHSSQGCDWRTTPELYAKLDQTFHFDLDLAATMESCLCNKERPTEILACYLGPDHPDETLRDALSVPWHTVGKVGFLNPPYSLSLYSDGLKAGVERKDLQWLLIEAWAQKAYQESLKGFTTVGVFPYAAQTEWFRRYVMGHVNGVNGVDWSGHAALQCWRIPYRVSYLRGDGTPAANANVNTCVVIFGPNPGWVGPWVPHNPYWGYR